MGRFFSCAKIGNMEITMREELIKFSTVRVRDMGCSQGEG